MELQAYNISRFCELHGPMSRAHFYKLLKAGRGPKVIKLGAKRMITIEAAKEWRAKLDAEAQEVRP